MFARGEQEKGTKKMNETPEPTKPETASKYEEALTSFGTNFEEATSRLSWRGGLSSLTRRWDETEENHAEKFDEVITDLTRRIAIWQTALEDLKRASNLRAEGEPALGEYNTALSDWYEQNRHRELFAANPETYTLHAIAVKKAIRKAQEKAGKKSHLEHYWIDAIVYGTISGLTRQEVDIALDDYIQARQVSYTLSTKNLKMKVA